jgi:EmrB/QacA subfamily drug resistance transporter
MTGRGGPRQSGGVLALLCAVQFMVLLDTTIANVALPSIGRAFDLPESGLQYVITLYAVTFGGCLILAGRAGDLLGRRRLFITGTALFVAASAACGLSVTPELLLAARAVQGLGAALISATALGLLLAIYAEGAQRNRALGIWSGLGATGAGAGLILGGLLTDTLGWQAVFLVNVPIGLAAIGLAKILPADGPSTLRRSTLDLPGAVTATAGISLLIYSLTRGQQDGFTTPVALALLVTAAVLLVVFILIQRRSPMPLVPLRIFSHGAVAGANLAILSLTAVMGGQGFFMMLYMQRVLDYSPVATGLAVLPSSIMAFIGSTLASKLTSRMPPRFIAVCGLTLVGVAELLLARISVDSSYPVDLPPGYIIFEIGLGTAFVGSSIVATSGIPAEDQGVVSGLLNTSQQVGIAVGVAALVTVAVAHTATQADPGSTAALVAGYRLGLLVSAGIAAAGALVILAFGGRPRRAKPTKGALATEQPVV